MSAVALDTNIVSAHLRGDPKVGAQIQSNSRLYLPVTVLGELYYGAWHAAHPDLQLARIQSFLPLVQTIHLDDEIGAQYGKLKAQLAKKGTLIPENDMWIAATCVVHDFTLAPRDAHFESVKNLRIVRWE